jgi:coiled-coil domain-containing protein 12
MLELLSGSPEPLRPLVFRNYVPRHFALRESVLPAPTIVAETELTVQRAVHQTLQEFAKEAPLDIVPRKPNWDLKRELTKKLAQLQGATDKAIVELVRTRH